MTINDALRKLLTTLGITPVAKSRSTSALINEIAEGYVPGGGSNLPDPSGEDDGRVLMTASGEWGVGNIPSGNVQVSVSTDGMSYFIDKTYAELENAGDVGLPITIKTSAALGGFIIYVSLISKTEVVGGRSMIGLVGYTINSTDSTLTKLNLMVFDDENVSLSTDVYTLSPMEPSA